MITLLIAALLSTAASDMPNRGWLMTDSPDEGIAKLQYFSGESLHGDVYATCRPSTDGFIHFSAAAITETMESETMRAGHVTVSAPAQAVADPGGDFTAVMIPASHRVFGAMTDGSSLEFAGAVYPVSTAAERDAIRQFIRICRQSDF
jgi:hypothetical protein